jgi:Mn2+/Fe2+ NRAMP family transporter
VPDDPPARSGETPRLRGLRRYLHALGPGIITGQADNDPAGIATYSVVGASTGFSLLWLIVLAFPMLYAVEEMSARIGSATKRGLQGLIMEKFGPVAGWLCASLVVAVNVATIGADIAGLSAGIELVTGVRWEWFVVPIGLGMGFLLWRGSYRTASRVFLWLTPLFFMYVISGFLARPNWPLALHMTVIPHLSGTTVFLLAAVGLLGTTVSPYLLFWQTTEEVEACTDIHELKQNRVDVALGMFYSNLVSYFIIIATATVLYPHLALRDIQTADQAALALQPLAGNLAFLLFTMGIVVAGTLAVPVLAASTSYVVMETLRGTEGLDKKFNEARGFYYVIFGAIAVGGGASLLGLSPIQLLFYSQVLGGSLMPIVLYFVIRLANDKGVMAENTSSWYINWIAWGTVVIMALFAVANVYQIVTGAGH